MASDSTSKAAKQNRALEPLRVLIGEWTTVGKHPLLPNITVHGQVSFQWLENGAFLIMHTSTDVKEIPAGIAIFGSDDGSEDFAMVYFDERGVSRHYTSAIKGNIWTWWRNDPKLSQRVTNEIIDGGNTIISKGEMSQHGGPWEKDLELTCTRIR